MAGYTKLFNSILASTIWREDHVTRIVWITLLAMSDKYGVAEGSIPGLADFARVTIPECQQALAKLMAPDEFSRSQVKDGQRIEAVEGGWRLVNHAKYRAMLSVDERREYNRLAQQQHRASKPVSKRKQKSALSAHTEATPSPTPSPTSADQTLVVSGFDAFWSAYPRKVGKGAARDEWAKLHPNANLLLLILAALDVQKTSDQWTKDGGQFVPHARTWLHQKRWEDEPDNRRGPVAGSAKTAGNFAAAQRFLDRGSQ